jgi:hypothetical protein
LDTDETLRNKVGRCTLGPGGGIETFREIVREIEEKLKVGETMSSGVGWDTGGGGGGEWWNGGMAAWWNGGMVEWWNGGMVERRNGGMMEWWNGGMVWTLTRV